MGSKVRPRLHRSRRPPGKLWEIWDRCQVTTRIEYTAGTAVGPTACADG